MPAIARITTYGRNAFRDRDRLIECLRTRAPFYMASTSGGPVTPDMRPSMGRLSRETAASIGMGVRAGLVDYLIWSYDTPIAWHVVGRGWVADDARYTRTTTDHQHLIRMAINNLEG